MGEQENIVNQLKVFKRDLGQMVHVNRMIFFGSRVSGSPHEDSDIDLVIVSNDFTDRRPRHRALGFRNYWNLDYAVDFLCYTPKEFEELSEQVTIVREAVQTGIEID
jgi:predicted nucleotidyltransferase